MPAVEFGQLRHRFVGLEHHHAFDTPMRCETPVAREE
jgi:hypothetical protein